MIPGNQRLIPAPTNADPSEVSRLRKRGARVRNAVGGAGLGLGTLGVKLGADLITSLQAGQSPTPPPTIRPIEATLPAPTITFDTSPTLSPTPQSTTKPLPSETPTTSPLEQIREQASRYIAGMVTFERSSTNIAPFVMGWGQVNYGVRFNEPELYGLLFQTAPLVPDIQNTPHGTVWDVPSDSSGKILVPSTHGITLSIDLDSLHTDIMTPEEAGSLFGLRKYPQDAAEKLIASFQQTVEGKNLSAENISMLNFRQVLRSHWRDQGTQQIPDERFLVLSYKDGHRNIHLAYPVYEGNPTGIQHLFGFSFSVIPEGRIYHLSDPFMMVGENQVVDSSHPVFMANIDGQLRVFTAEDARYLSMKPDVRKSVFRQQEGNQLAQLSGRNPSRITRPLRRI